MSEEKPEDKKPETKSGSGASDRTIMFMAMLHDNTKSDTERAMAFQKLVFDSQMELLDRMGEVREKIVGDLKVELTAFDTDMKAAVAKFDADLKAGLDKIDGDIRARDGKQHDERNSLAATLRAELKDATSEGQAKTFRELILNPKLLKEWGSTVVAVAAMIYMLVTTGRGPDAPPPEPEKTKTEKRATEDPSGHHTGHAHDKDESDAGD